MSNDGSGGVPNSLEQQVAALTATVQQQQAQIDQCFVGPSVDPTDYLEQILEPDDEREYGDDTNDEFNQMMNNIVPTDDGVGEGSFNDNPEILEALADIEKPVEFGPAITVPVAEAYNNTVTRQLSKETSEKLKQAIKIPQNCKPFVVPKMNPEIWQMLTPKARVTDLKFQSIQNTMSSGLTVLALISNEMAQRAGEIPKDLVTKVLKLAMDGANLLGTQVQEITKKRRLEEKPVLSPEYSGICNAQLPASELLFGGNLAETMKSTKTVSAIIRNSTLPRNRFLPYRFQQRSHSLNYNRPPQRFRGRWSGPNYQNQNRFQRRFQPMGSRPQFQTPNQTYRK